LPSIVSLSLSWLVSSLRRLLMAAMNDLFYRANLRMVSTEKSVTVGVAVLAIVLNLRVSDLLGTPNFNLG